jgi:hypothetical protein
MPATDNSTVQVTINVVDANSGEVISRVTKSLNDFGNAGAGSGKKVASGLNEAGEAGTKAGQKISQGMDGAKGHITTSLDSVRLLSQEFGLRLPRALESMAARIPGVTSALSGLLGVMAGIAIAQVFVQVAQNAYKLYEQYISLNAAADKYYETLKKTREESFGNPRDIETASLRFTQSTHDAQLKAQQARELRNKSIYELNPISAVGDFLKSRDIANQGVAAMGQRDQTAASGLSLQHERTLAQIELNHALDSTLTGMKKINAEAEKRKQIEAENNSFSIASQRFTGNPVSPEAGQALQRIKDQTADQEAAAQKIALNREMSMAIMKADDARIQAGMSGEDLYFRKRQDDIKELTAEMINAGKAAEIPASIREINTKFLEDSSERFVKLANETSLTMQRSGAAGLKGQARLDAEHDIQINQINSNPSLAANPDQASSERGAANSEYQQKSLESQQQFNDRLAQMDASRSDRYASANQRIQSTADHTIAEITKAWTEMYGQLNALDQRRVQSQQALNAEIVKIQQDAARQKQEAGQRVEDETEKMEEEGARAGHSRDQERTQEILDEYNDRYRQLEELRVQDSDNADKYRRQEIAAEQIKNGKLLDQQRELRDKLAGQLKGFFSNPLQELQRQGEEAASKIAASFILKMNPGTTLGGGYGDPGLGGHHGSLLGHITGTGATHSAANHSQTTLTASTATIYLQSATFAGVSAPGSKSGGFAGGSFSGASTSSLPALPGMAQSTAALGGELGVGVKSPATSMVGVGTSASGGSGSSTYSSVSSTLSSLPKMTDSVSQLQQEVAPGMKMPLVTEAKNSKLGKALGSSKAAGLASGGLGLAGAVEGNGGFGGALQGAFSGAKVGSELGGPIGAAIGAIGGAVLGVLGFGGKSKAEDYNNKQVKPRIADELQAYEAGSMDYQTVYNDFDSLSREAKIATRQWGSGGESVYNNEIKSEISTAQTRLTREQKAGRSEYGMTAAQFHEGGFINNFGSMGTNNGQGWIHAEQGEFVLQQHAAMTHSTAAQLINSGASHSQMASYYGANKAPVASGGSSDVSLHFHSPDAKGAMQLFMDNKHHIRAALNQSYAENSGGSDFA